MQEVDFVIEALGLPSEAEASSAQITSIASNRSFASMTSMDGLVAPPASATPRTGSGSATPQDTYVRRSSGLSQGDRDAAVPQAAEPGTPSQRTGAGCDAHQARAQGQQRQHRARAGGSTPPTSLSGSESLACTVVASASFKRCVAAIIRRRHWQGRTGGR